MLICITQKGLNRIVFLREELVRGEQRFYFVGADDATRVVIVAIGKKPEVGGLWDANSGNERGFPGFCRDAHLHTKIGKLTLRGKVNKEHLSPSSVIHNLDAQIEYLIEHVSE